ncbi:MAG: M1 family metallopeptidase [Bacteroidetes bacterium]|nr:M1 family metallopeptidase [Bacteroidota bacterium]
MKKRKRILLFYLLLTISFSSCSLLGIHIKVHNPKKAGKEPKFNQETILLGELTPVRESFDVVFYGLDIQLHPEEKTLGGWVEIRAKALVDIDSIQIDLEKSLRINEIRFGSREGATLKYTRIFRAVYLKMDHQIKKGQTFSVHVNYDGKPIIARKPPWAGGLVWKKDKEKNAWAGVACESEGASIWFPCKDHTSDEPDSSLMRFSIAEKNLMVISNGVLQAIDENATYKSFTWKVNNPINTYNITFYLGNFERIDDSYTGLKGQTLSINHYVLKPNVSKAKEHFKQVKNHLLVYEQLYGEFPWYDDGLKLVESPYSGKEHQSGIAYGNGFKNDLYGKEDYIMLHETGHEWFGNAISVADLADVWLQEGVTTYGEVLYLEKEYGSNLAYNHLLFYRWTIKNKRPVVGPSGRRYFDYHDGDVYVKGAWTLHTLRNQIANDSIFLKIMQTFYDDYKYKTTSTAQFIQTVNSVTNKNYNWLFNQYLFERKAPVFEYYISKDGYLYYRWMNTAVDFNKIKVPFTIENDATLYDVFPSSKVQRYKLKEGTNFTSEVAVDNSSALFGKSKNRKLLQKYEATDRSK